MRANILITDDNGNQFTTQVDLHPVKESTKKQLKVKVKNYIPLLNFDMNIRAFIHKFSSGMSGPKKFVLLLAFLVKGEIGKEESLKNIEKNWAKLTSLLRNRKDEKGEFNRFYPGTAKVSNWVTSKKQGYYCLTPNWKEIVTTKRKK